MLRILGTTEKRALVHFAPPPQSLRSQEEAGDANGTNGSVNTS